MSFSQFGEDLLVARIFGDAEPGTCLDIGAWGPGEFSNVRLFLDRGWDGVLVELSPMPLHSLLTAFGSEWKRPENAPNQKIQIISAAITPGPEHVTEFEITQDCISSANAEHNARWRKQGYEFYGKLWVPTLSVRELLDQFFGDATLDYASVDTEGTSVEIAIALAVSDHHPRVMVVEYDNQLPHLLEEVGKYGYGAVAGGVNSTNVVLERR